MKRIVILYFIITVIIITYHHYNEYKLVIFTTFILNGNISARKEFVQLFVYNTLLDIVKNCNDIKLIIFSENASVNIKSSSKNVKIKRILKFNIYKTPYFGGLFDLAIKTYVSKFYMFVNGDIIISPYIRKIIMTLVKYINFKILKENILCVATRSSLYSNIYNISKSYNHYKLYKIGKKSSPYSQDVFIMTKYIYIFNFELYNKLLIGRAGIDNIILGTALNNKMIDVIDGTDSISPIHLEDCKTCKKQYVSVYLYFLYYRI